MDELRCQCGEIIPESEIDYRNTANEIGEEYGVVSAQCPHCLQEYEASEWGHFEDLDEAIELLDIAINYKK